jgi:hypothetical protein
MNSPNDITDLIAHMSAILGGMGHHEGSWDTVQHLIRSAALEGIDIVDIGYAIREAETGGLFTHEDAEALINIVNLVEQEIQSIETDYDG